MKVDNLVDEKKKKEKKLEILSKIESLVNDEFFR